MIRAERDGRREVCPDDVDAAYGHARYVHLAIMGKILDEGERRLLCCLAEMSIDGRTGFDPTSVYTYAKRRMKLATGVFYERIRKFEEMRLVEVQRSRPDRIQAIVLRYDPQKVLDLCG